MSKYGINADNLLRTFPDVLKEDEKMLALASIVADLLSKRINEIDKIRIYPQIENLSEPLLDILAHDFKVDWYGYNYGVNVKRAQIKDSFSVYQTLGTRGAMEKALSDIYKGTEVEEWFEYGGDPFYFRVLLDVTFQQEVVSHDEIVRAINIFKPIRSYLQDNAVIYRSRANIKIEVVTGYVVYNVRLCGTYPVRATQGAITNEDIVLLINADGVVYSVPMSGEIKTGTHPEIAMQGGEKASGINIGDSSNGISYRSPMCGSVPGSLI